MYVCQSACGILLNSQHLSFSIFEQMALLVRIVVVHSCHAWRTNTPLSSNATEDPSRCIGCGGGKVMQGLQHQEAAWLPKHLSGPLRPTEWARHNVLAAIVPKPTVWPIYTFCTKQREFVQRPVFCLTIPACTMHCLDMPHQAPYMRMLAQAMHWVLACNNLVLSQLSQFCRLRT
jgi:hypothetical protein